MLVSHFGRNRNQFTSQTPMSEDHMRRYAPAIFADGAHESRSDRYTYIPTIELLRGLKNEGFEPFMVAQARTRDEGQRDHAKHLVRLRHANHLSEENANEIILLNSHNGTSSYQMLSGVFRFVCANGLICGDRHHDIRVPHKGNIKDQVMQGANVILEDFDLITEARETMQAIALAPREQQAFAAAALQLRYDDPTKPAPIDEEQVLRPRRKADTENDLWTVFNRVQENVIRGGQLGRNAKGRPARTRAVNGIDQSTALNRALWTLAEALRDHKA